LDCVLLDALALALALSLSLAFALRVLLFLFLQVLLLCIFCAAASGGRFEESKRASERETSRLSLSLSAVLPRLSCTEAGCGRVEGCLRTALSCTHRD
jgi:hypothetical protein